MTDLFTYADTIKPAPPSYPDGVPPEICDLFEQLTIEVRARGFDRYFARAILHRIRWHHAIERGDRAFKANNNWTPAIARWVMSKRPELQGFFETRERVEEGYSDG